MPSFSPPPLALLLRIGPWRTWPSGPSALTPAKASSHARDPIARSLSRSSPTPMPLPLTALSSGGRPWPVRIMSWSAVAGSSASSAHLIISCCSGLVVVDDGIGLALASDTSTTASSSSIAWPRHRASDREKDMLVGSRGGSSFASTSSRGTAEFDATSGVRSSHCAEGSESQSWRNAIYSPDDEARIA